MEEIIDFIINEKDILMELIKIDNQIMYQNMTYDMFLNKAMEVIGKRKYIETDKKLLFITEGNPILTLNILNNIVMVDKEVVLFVNQSYQGLNRWLFDKYLKITGNVKHTIDFGINYNKYIGRDYKVVSIGEKEFREEVFRDFYE